MTSLHTDPRSDAGPGPKVPAVDIQPRTLRPVVALAAVGFSIPATIPFNK
jgi:hypothetical protein